MKNNIIWAVILVIVVGGLVAFAVTRNDADDQTETADTTMEQGSDDKMSDDKMESDEDDSHSSDDAMEKDGDAMMEQDGDAMMEKDGEAMEADAMDGEAMEVDDDKMMAKREGAYIDYDEARLSDANDGKVVLFFHAAWCPTCIAANADITANKADIPEGMTIMKVDYDTASALKDKYGVTYQHTFVQVDAEGNQLKKWNGGELDTIVDRAI